MKIGLHFVNFDVPGGVHALPTTLATTAQTAEQAGAAWMLDSPVGGERRVVVDSGSTPTTI